MKHCLVLEADYLQSLRLQIRVAFFVMGFRFCRIVDFPITLHYQSCLVAVEVANVIPELMLPPELRARELTIPQ